MFEQQEPGPERRTPSSTTHADDASPGWMMSGIRAMIEPLPEAILVADASGRIQLTNDAADRLFDGDPVRTATDLLSRLEDGRPPAGASDETAADDATDRRMVRPRHLPTTWYALDRVPLAEADGDGAAFVLRDVSDSGDRQVEREAFLSVLSHELRTPLTTIYAGSSVLARRPRLSAPATRTLAMDISLEAARLYDLVENLLVIARLERRMLHPIDEAVDLGMALDAEMRIASGRVAGIRIEREGPSTVPPVHGDATYVAQACRNLIQSMLRVPARDAAVRLVARLEVDRVAREVSVRILDEGPSLTIDELDRAFDLPLSTATGRLGGVGMGPFVARHAVAAMGGRTWARDRVGGGLEMGFALRIHDGVGRRPGASAGR